MDYRAVYETLKSPKEIEKLLSDPKQTATALLAVKYGVSESTGINLSFNLMALSKLLSEHPSAWNVVDNSLIDKIVQISIAPEQESNVTCPAPLGSYPHYPRKQKVHPPVSHFYRTNLYQPSPVLRIDCFKAHLFKCPNHSLCVAIYQCDSPHLCDFQKHA